MSAPAVEAPTPVYLALGTLAAEETSEGAREFTGLALPYGEDMDRPNYMTGALRQRFAEGSAKFRDVTLAYYGHDHLAGGTPIGKITSIEDTPQGPRVTGLLSRTPKAEEIYTLLRDGVLSKMSIGYIESAWHMEEEGALQVHDEIDVFEVSVVPRPQYDSADIDGVLHQQQHPNNREGTRNMTDTLVKPEEIEALSAAQTSLTESVETLSRQVATLGDITAANSDAPPIAIPGDSFGEFLSLVTQKGGPDPEAAAFLAYVGGVVGDLGDWVKDTWVGDIIRVVEKPRHAMNFFESAPLPESGMGVEYGKVLGDTTAVGEQVNEGDVLPYGKISFETATARLKTYGGWGEMSFQEIQRSSFAVVQKFFEALARRYGVTTEAAVRGRLQTATGATVIAGTDLTTADGWIRFIVKAAARLDEKGLSPEAMFVDEDTFIDLATLRDGQATDAPRLLNRDSGAISVTGLSGSMFNVPVKMLGTLTAGTVRIADSAAIKTFEASGAPFRLQDQDITNLTQAASVYGYLAVAEQEPTAIVKPGA